MRKRSEMPGLPDILVSRLRARDAVERDCFKRLIAEHSLLQTRNEQLEKRIVLLQHGGPAEVGDGGGAVHSLRAELAACKQQVGKLQTELLHKYKNAAQIATTAVSASNESEKLRDRLAIVELEMAQCITRYESAEAQVASLESKRKEQDEQLALYREELQRLRKERGETEKKMSKLSRDNHMLVQRMLEDKNQLSAELNRMNVLYERLRSQTGSGRPMGRSGSQTQASHGGEPASSKSTPGSKPTMQASNSTATSNRAWTYEGEHGASSSSSKASDSALDSRERGAVAQSTLPREAKVWARAHKAKVTALCYGPDGGRSFVTSSDDGTIKLWDIARLSEGSNGTFVHTNGSNAPYTCVDWVGNYVLGGSTDRVATIFDVRTQKESRRLSSHVGKILCCSFVGQSPSEAITGSNDASIKLWDTRQGYPTRTIGCSSVCNCLDVAPGGMMCCSGHLDGVVRVWDLRSGKSLQEIRGRSHGSMVSVQFSHGRSSDNLLLTVSRDNAARIFDSLTWELTSTISDNDFAVGANSTQGSLSPDGCYVAVGSGMGSVFVWDAVTCHRLCKLDKHQSVVTGCCWRGDGRQVITADQRGYVVAWG